jgi:hypothetical protein
VSRIVNICFKEIYFSISDDVLHVAYITDLPRKQPYINFGFDEIADIHKILFTYYFVIYWTTLSKTQFEQRRMNVKNV